MRFRPLFDFYVEERVYKIELDGIPFDSAVEMGCASLILRGRAAGLNIRNPGGST